VERGVGPVRLVIFYTRWGTSYPEWLPTGADRNFTLGPILAPLAPFQHYLIPVDGLTNELTKTGRFTNVRSLDKLDLRSYGAGVFPSTLPWDSVEKICRQSNSDLLFSLELFDAESNVGIGAGPVAISASQSSRTRW